MHSHTGYICLFFLPWSVQLQPASNNPKSFNWSGNNVHLQFNLEPIAQSFTEWRMEGSQAGWQIGLRTSRARSIGLWNQLLIGSSHDTPLLLLLPMIRIASPFHAVFLKYAQLYILNMPNCISQICPTVFLDYVQLYFSTRYFSKIIWSNKFLIFEVGTKLIYLILPEITLISCGIRGIMVMVLI